MQALLPAARLHLARGDHELARAAARRGLRGIGDDRLRAAELLTVLVDAELARGDLDAAMTACADLTSRTGDIEVPALQARALGCPFAGPGRVRRPRRGDRHARGDRRRSRRGPLPWLRATLLLDLARLREQAGDETARLDAKAAAGVLPNLDVVLAPADVALLERLDGPPPARAANSRARARREVVGRDVRRPTRAIAGQQGRPLPRRAARPPRRRAPRARPRRSGRGCRARRRPPCAGRCGRAARRRRPRRVPPPCRATAQRTSTTRWRPVRWTTAESTAGRARPARQPSWPGRTASAVESDGPLRPSSGPGSTSRGRCERRSPSSPTPCPTPAPCSTVECAPACTACTSPR